MGRKMRWLGLMAVVCTLWGVTGCTYAKNRAMDLKDCFKVNVALGGGLYAGLTATDCFVVPMGGYVAMRLGTDGRTRPQWCWQETKLGWLVGANDEVAEDSGLLKTLTRQAILPFYQQVELWPYVSWPARDYGVTYYSRGTKSADRYWFEVEGFALFAGARVGFNPLEFADFIDGIFMVDFVGDDQQQPPSEE